MGTKGGLIRPGLGEVQRNTERERKLPGLKRQFQRRVSKRGTDGGERKEGETEKPCKQLCECATTSGMVLINRVSERSRCQRCLKLL